MDLWLKIFILFFGFFIFSENGNAQSLILEGKQSCKPENQCGELCCADTDCCSSEGHCCKECIDTEACLKAGNILENIDGCYVCKENPNACKKKCTDMGMTGATTTKCDCICDVRLGFKPIAVNEKCVCRDGFQKLLHENRCVECFTDSDCKGDCMVCNANNTCVEGTCCKKENMRCNMKEDNCCGKLSCSSHGLCCPSPETKKCPPHQKLVIPSDRCAYCKDLPSPKKTPKQTLLLPQNKSQLLPENKHLLPPQNRSLPKPEIKQPVSPHLVSDSWECKGPISKGKGKTYSGKNIIPTDELTFLFFDKKGTTLTLSYLDTGPSGSPSTHGVAHWNTNDRDKSHVLKEISLPYKYYVDPNSVKGKSYGKGCETMNFSGITNTITMCTHGHVQNAIVEWEFTICPSND